MRPLRKNFSPKPMHWIVGVLSFAYMAITLCLFSPILTNPHIIADDVGQHIAPMYSFIEGVDLEDDLITEYKLAYQPPGYLALFRLMAPVIDPLTLGGCLTLLLIATTWFLAYKIGDRVGGPTCGWLTALLTAHSEFVSAVMFGGLYRAFGPPLLLCFIYFCMRKRWLAACLVLIMQALFYPPVFLICCGAMALCVVVECKAWLGERRRALIAVCLTAMVGLAILFSVSEKPEHFGELVTLEEAGKMREWSRRDGRFKELPFHSHKALILQALGRGLNSIYEGASVTPRLEAWNVRHHDRMLWVFLLITAIGLISVRRRAEPIVYVMASGLVCYGVARHFAFRLGWPGRYIDYALPFLPIFLYALYWRTLSAFRSSKPLAGTLLSLVPVLLIPFFYSFGFTGVKGLKATDTTELQGAIAFARELPEPVLFAGWPYMDMDNIYTFAHKKVLADHESAHPLYKDYYAEVRRRIRAMIRLCYAFSMERTLKIRDEYGVTHVLIRRKMLEDPHYNPHLYAPMRSKGLRTRKQAWRRGLLFTNAPNNSVVYTDDTYLIVDLRRLTPNVVDDEEP